ncbi:MAG TPA: hypothetical protein VEC16_02880, partial [Alphaproteobacteria bacterium]|nr:hypothetical protein [Alphaproteobacteria bacterium]
MALRNNLGQGKNAANIVLVPGLVLILVLLSSSMIYALNAADFTSENTKLSVSSRNDVLYLELFNSNTLITNTDLSSSHSLEVTNLETGFTYKYFGGLIFPIEIPKDQGKYVFTLSDKKSNVISQIYLEYNSDDTFRIYDSRDKNVEIPLDLDEPLGTGTSSEISDELSNKSRNESNEDIISKPSSDSQTVLSTDKKEYVLGEVVSINVDVDSEIKDFYIMSETSKYLFTGYIPDGSPLTFNPMEKGKHRIVLSSGGSNFEIIFEVFDKKETDIMSRNYESLEQYMNSISAEGSVASREVLLRDSTGRSAFISAVAYNTRRGEKQDPGAIDTVKGLSRLVSKKSTNVVQGIIDPEYVPEEYSIDDIYAVDISEQIVVDLNSVPHLETSKLELENVVVDVGADLEIRIETVPENKLSLQKNIIESFAMDFSNLDFQTGTFTKIATGEELWKCREWNYMQQRCNGDWVKIKDLTPGVEYTIEVSPVDPGYAETGVSTINSDKPIYLPGEIATLNTAVLDKFGSLVNNAHLTVTVITPSSDNYVYTTETGDIYSISKGIYRMQFPHTEEEGEYTIIVSAYARIVNSTMISKFVVDSDYEFDIIRHSELSVDPYKGSYLMNIDVTPKLSLQSYDFTDKIPVSIEVLETNGEIIVNESGKFIQWTGLTDAYSAFYRYKAPFDIPSVLTFGPSSIIYTDHSNNQLSFIEPREWYVAIDPEVPTTDGIMFYGDRTPDGGVKYRNWTSDLLYSEQYDGIDLGGRSSWMKVRCSEYLPQCILGVSNNDDDFGFSVFFTNNWSMASYGDLSTDLANNPVPWDVECESISGRCIVAYESSQSAADGFLFYRIWNGTNLSLNGPFNFTFTSAIAGNESFPITWIKLYPKNGTNIMGVAIQNNGGGNTGTPAIYGAIWNGSNFTQWQLFTNNSITNGNEFTQHKHFDCAWSSNRFYCIYSNESSPRVLMYSNNGSLWTNHGSIYNDTGGEVWEVSACGMEPWSVDTNDYIGFMACSQNATTATNRIDGGIWNGTSFSKLTWNQSGVPIRNNFAECGTAKGTTETGQNFRCQWESSGNQIIFLWVNSGQDYIRYGTYTKSTKAYSFSNFSIGNQIVVDGPSDIRSVNSISNSFNDQIFLTYTDSSRTAGCSVWTGNSWDGTGCNNSATFETDGARAASNWLTFDWFRLQLQPYINIVNPVITTTTKDYFGITNPSTTFIAYNGTSATLPVASVFAPANRTAEFSTACYFATTSSDDTYCMTNTSNITSYGYQSFQFYVTESVVNIDSFKINYEGRGTNTTASTPIDMRIYIYNFTSDSYVFVKTIFGGGGADSYTEAIVDGRASDLVVNNSLWVLIIPASSTGPAAAGTRRHEIWTDYISLDINTL